MGTYVEPSGLGELDEASANTSGVAVAVLALAVLLWIPLLSCDPALAPVWAGAIWAAIFPATNNATARAAFNCMRSTHGPMMPLASGSPFSAYNGLPSCDAKSRAILRPALRRRLFYSRHLLPRAAKAIARGNGLQRRPHLLWRQHVVNLDSATTTDRLKARRTALMDT